MSQKRKELTLSIDRLKKSIRRKYNAFKHGIVETEEMLEKQYQPIIKHLRKKEEVEPLIKKEEQEEEKEEEEEGVGEVERDSFGPKHSSTPIRMLKDEITFGDISEEEEGDPDIVSRELNTDYGFASATQFIDENFTNPLAKKYMKKLIKDKATLGSRGSIDHIYGPRYEGNELMVGDKSLTFDEADGAIRVGDVRYNPTEGLYELLFKKNPDEVKYNEDDLAAYRDILIKSSGHKKDYISTGKINRFGGSQKYKQIISNLFPVKVYGGRGVVSKSLRSPDYTYWDNPNELCDRLRLLVASAETGNTAHTNEILNIVEELREANIIKGKGNLRYRSLLR